MADLSTSRSPTTSDDPPPSGSGSSESTPPFAASASTSASAAATVDQQQPQQTQQTQQQQQQKRTRVLLSCGYCRAAKLKCDRQTPCSQCAKRGRADDCVYAPRPLRHHRPSASGGGVDGAGAAAAARPAKSVAARLRRLEGMVREMIDGEGGGAGTMGSGSVDGKLAEMLQERRRREGEAAAAAEEEREGKSGGSLGKEDDDHRVGQLVQGERATTWVGATHFMAAMLDDIEDLKAFFDDTEDSEEQQNIDYAPETAPKGSWGRDCEGDSPELLLLGEMVPRSRQDLLDLIPSRHVADRLVMRYFGSSTPSGHVIHRPSFVRKYNQFWQDPSAATIEWLALFLMLMALGVFFSSFSAPHELAADNSSGTAEQRFKTYRAAAAWALVAGKYTSPGRETLQPLLLYVESEYLVNRSSGMNCYLLSGVLIRIMLKMGLHRDPSKLPGITPFDGEMRRRIWCLAVQIDLIVSFHMGLPCMIQGIDSDTEVPRNILDEDFDEDSLELPASQPDSQMTAMAYPIWKCVVIRVFGHIARQAHAITAPPYSEVLRVDDLLDSEFARVPSFMRVRPLADCVADPPSLVVQRFTLAALHQKSRVILHRRYITESNPNLSTREHDRSRRLCLDAALQLLDYQDAIFHATRPSGMLRPSGWFITSLTQHDFLLAATILYLVVQNPLYPHTGWAAGGVNSSVVSNLCAVPGKDELVLRLRSSERIWTVLSADIPETRRAANMLRILMEKIRTRNGEGAVYGAGDDMGGDGGDGGLGSLTNLHLQQHQQEQQQMSGTGSSRSGFCQSALRNSSNSNSGGVSSDSSNEQREAAASTAAAALTSDGINRPFHAMAPPSQQTTESLLFARPSASMMATDPVDQVVSNTGGSGAGVGGVGGADAAAGAFNTSWILPLDTESLDWSLVDQALRTNGFVDTDMVEDWLGTAQPLTDPNVVTAAEFWSQGQQQ